MQNRQHGTLRHMFSVRRRAPGTQGLTRQRNRGVWIEPNLQMAEPVHCPRCGVVLSRSLAAVALDEVVCNACGQE